VIKKNKLIITFLFATIALITFSTSNASAASYIYQEDSFIYQVGTDWVYPSGRNGATDIYFNANSWGSVKTGEYMVYLQRAVDGDWVTVGHAGVPRNGEKTVNFTREYSGHALYEYTPYRFLLKNDNSITINYIVQAF
jgi:hypothetical protein